MKYLFFDIECANCFNGKGKIYSYGYLVTDEKFNIIDGPRDILMNPDAKFDPYVKKNILVYDRQMLKTMPKFNERYEEIKNLMTKENTICLGYGVVDNDMRFLKNECERYDLPLIEVECLDVQKIIKIVDERPAKKLGIEFNERFGEVDDVVHKSDSDAVMTMKIAKDICEKSNKTIEYFLKEIKTK